MGVRLVRYNRPISGNTDSNAPQSNDHDELINRDLLNQHPIYAITGLQEALNFLEDNLNALANLVNNSNTDINIKINNIVSDLASLEKRMTDAETAIKKLQSMKYISSESIAFNYDPDAPALKADVRIWQPKSEDKENTNILRCLGDGLYVPRTTYKDSTTITWDIEVKGETLKEIFDNGIVFSHGRSSWDNIYSPSEANAWYWDDTLQSIVQPLNTGYTTGFVSKDVYDNYEHQVTIRSTNGDDDTNGVVIGYVVDDIGHPHTLSVTCTRGDYDGYTSGCRMFTLWYDFWLPDAQNLGYKTIGGGSGGWSSTSGITINVQKHGSIVSVVCSPWGSNVLDESMRITIDLSHYTWGSMFDHAVHYGYCNLSQASSFFQDIYFSGFESANENEIAGMVVLSKDSTNGLSIKQDGLYSERFDISKKANNAITKQADGYYVESFRVSSQSDNALKKLADGTYYVREHSNIRLVTQVNHGFAVGDFIYYRHDKAYQKALALDSYDANIVGMVTKVINASQFEYQWSGFFATTLFNTASGYTQGMPVYISDVNPGRVVQDQPDISKTVGYPVENAGIIIAIERGIQYNQEASIGDFKKSANTFSVRSDGFILITDTVDYKQSLIQRLIDSSTAAFKSQYMTFDNVNATVRFKNVKELYDNNSVATGMNLFIKAF